MKILKNLPRLLLIPLFLTFSTIHLQALSTYTLTSTNLSIVVNDIHQQYKSELLIGVDSLQSFLEELLAITIDPLCTSPDPSISAASGSGIAFRWNDGGGSPVVRFSYLDLFQGNSQSMLVTDPIIALTPFSYQYHLYAFSTSCSALTQSAIDIVIVDKDIFLNKKPISADRGPEQIATSTKDFLEISNSPNPFHTNTSIRYNLPKAGTVSIHLYHIGSGKRMFSLVRQQWLEAGQHQFILEKDLPAGVYTCVLQTDFATKSIRLIKLGNS